MEENEGVISTDMTREEAAAPLGPMARELRSIRRQLNYSSEMILALAIELRKIRYLLELEVLVSEDRRKKYSEKLSKLKPKQP